MRTRPPMPPQFALFDFRKEGEELATPRAITPGCLLPYPNSETIDVRRACAILDTDKDGLRRLQQRGCIAWFRLGSSMRWSVSYQSVVDFCDSLLVEYAIPSRRPPLRKGQHRWADRYLLPFPAEDTVTVKDAMDGLDATKNVVLNLIEEGRFEAYRLIPNAPWRISLSSLRRYSESLRAQVASVASSRSGSRM